MSTPPQNTPPQPTWSSEARTVASLLLFAHLFALLVAVTTYTRPSPLQQRLHELFDPYLRNLHLTAYPVSYPFARYHLTHALPSDVDYVCQIEFQDAAGVAHTETIPPAGLRLPIRSRRYQLLANATGTLADDEAFEEIAGILPKAIAGSILRQHGASAGVFKCRAHEVPFLEDMGNVESGRRQVLANYRDVYEAQVLVSAERVDLLRKSQTLEVAPVERGARGPSASGQPGTNQRPPGERAAPNQRRP
jgi:hypothetical protein